MNFIKLTDFYNTMKEILYILIIVSLFYSAYTDEYKFNLTNEFSIVKNNLYLPPMKNIPLVSKFGHYYEKSISGATMFVFNFTESFREVFKS